MPDIFDSDKAHCQTGCLDLSLSALASEGLHVSAPPFSLGTLSICNPIALVDQVADALVTKYS